jgi:hypothetical protein
VLKNVRAENPVEDSIGEGHLTGIGNEGTRWQSLPTSEFAAIEICGQDGGTKTLHCCSVVTWSTSEIEDQRIAKVVRQRLYGTGRQLKMKGGGNPAVLCEQSNEIDSADTVVDGCHPDQRVRQHLCRTNARVDW